MQNVYIIYGRYYDFDGNQVSIGGVQTYISNLCGVLDDFNLRVHILQQGKTDDFFCIGFADIRQIEAKNLKQFKKKLRNYFNHNNISNGLIIFASDTMAFDVRLFGTSIAIQHGVFWDVPLLQPRGILRGVLSKAKRAFLNIKTLQHINKIVCVDYNFINWFRSQVEYNVDNITVIPNFTRISDRIDKSDTVVKIIFARRLFAYRGTRIFTSAIKKLLTENLNIFVTIAGVGEDEQWMRDQLKGFDRVEFITYQSQNSLDIHKDKHIAVVPTIGSEGTSLSLLEAMSAQCAVVCSNVGGMTNVVIDGYNGLMISPREEELYEAIIRLIKDGDLRKRLAFNAYQTVRAGFSYEKWRESWKRLLQKVIAE